MTEFKRGQIYYHVSRDVFALVFKVDTVRGGAGLPQQVARLVYATRDEVFSREFRWRALRQGSRTVSAGATWKNGVPDGWAQVQALYGDHGTVKSYWCERR